MNFRKVNQIVFIGIIISVFCLTTSHSTTMIELSLKEMCQRSNHIIIARTISKDSYYVMPGQQRIYTDITLEVSDKIKGRFQKQDRFKVTLYGGTVNGITTFVVGGPTFSVGEQSVLLLSERQSSRSGKNYFNVIGLSQGKFDIITDNKINKQKVVRDQLQWPLRLEKDGTSLSLTNSKSITLASFLNYIRNYI